jgi:hypothetical protein
MIITKIVHVEIKDGKRTEHILSPEEVKQWKKEHTTNDSTEAEDKPDTKS